MSDKKLKESKKPANGKNLVDNTAKSLRKLRSENKSHGASVAIQIDESKQKIENEKLGHREQSKQRSAKIDKKQTLKLISQKDSNNNATKIHSDRLVRSTEKSQNVTGKWRRENLVSDPNVSDKKKTKPIELGECSFTEASTANVIGIQSGGKIHQFMVDPSVQDGIIVDVDTHEFDITDVDEPDIMMAASDESSPDEDEELTETMPKKSKPMRSVVVTAETTSVAKPSTAASNNQSVVDFNELVRTKGEDTMKIV